MATIKPLSVSAKRLAQTINGSATSFKLDNILTWDGSTNLAASDFGTKAYAAFRNSAGTLIEFMEIDPSTIASASITINNRGLKYNGDDLTTEVAANKLTWVKGDTIVELGTHLPQLLAHYVDIVGDQTIAGVKTFSSTPVLPAAAPTAAAEAANKAYVDLVAGGSANYDQNLIAAVAGATIAAGEVVYLKESDGEWYLADASASATSENLVIGIAQGAGTDGVAISGGVLVGGIDKNATYTAGAKYFITDVAGALGTSAGTVEVLIGTGDANNNLVFEHIVTNESLTAGQKDAAVGNNTDIAVGTGNKYVTQTGLQDGAEIYAADAQASDTYVITLSPVPAALETGMVIHFKANTANTGACTLNVNSLGAKSIKKLHDQDPATGDIESGQIVTVIYDGTNFQMQSQIAQNSTEIFEFSASDTLQVSADVEDSHNSTTYTKQKEVQVNRVGQIRIKFDIKYVTAGDANGQIYINDVATGTIRTDSTGTYQTFSEDLYVSAGDRVQLYTRSSTGGANTVSHRNFRLYWDTAVGSEFNSILDS